MKTEEICGGLYDYSEIEKQKLKDKDRLGRRFMNKIFEKARVNILFIQKSTDFIFEFVFIKGLFKKIVRAS